MKQKPKNKVIECITRLTSERIYIKFKDYDEYKEFILKSRKIKDSRYEGEN